MGNLSKRKLVLIFFFCITTLFDSVPGIQCAYDMAN